MATDIKNCPQAALYDSLRFCQGERVLPGIRQKVYCIPKRDVVAWPKLPDATAADADFTKLATYTGNFTLAADKKWLLLDLAQNKGQIEWETQGDRPARTFLNKFTLYSPLIDGSAAAFQMLAISDDLLFLVQQRDGKFRLLGNEMFETDVKPKGATGEGLTGEAGSQFEIEVTDIAPAPFYPGTISTKDDGEISGEDGSTVAAKP